MKTQIRNAIKATKKYSFISVEKPYRHDKPGHFVRSFANPEGHLTFIVKITVKEHRIKKRAAKRSKTNTDEAHF